MTSWQLIAVQCTLRSAQTGTECSEFEGCTAGEVWRSLDVLRTPHKVLVPLQRACAVIIVDLVSWNERSSGGVMASLAFISFYFPRSTDIAQHAGTQAGN